MLVINCESQESAADSVSRIYEIPVDELIDFIQSMDLDEHYRENDVLEYADRELRALLEKTFKRKPKQADRIIWFHLTRVSKDTTFERGILPLTISLPYVWDVVLRVFEGTPHEARLRGMKENGVKDFQYALKAGKPIHGGPYAMLVRESAWKAQEMGNHDYLGLPEIMEDICNGYLSSFKESLHADLMRKLAPTIVKFWSDGGRMIGCTEAALYYTYVSQHKNEMTICSNTCFDGQNQAVEPNRIMSIERLN